MSNIISSSNDLTVPHRYNDKFYDNQNFKITQHYNQNADHSMSDSYSLKTICKFI